MTKTITCVDCGAGAERRGPTTKRCVKCQKAKSLADKRASYHRRKTEGPIGDTLTCVDCGAIAKRTGHAQKRCAECAKTAQRAAVQKYMARKRAEVPGYGRVICLDCGCEVKRRGSMQVRCAECQAEATRNQARERRRHPEARRRRREYAIKYRAENAEIIAEKKSRYYWLNAENRRAANRAYYQENKAKYLRSRRREMERDAAVPANRSRAPWTPAEDAVLASWTGTQRELGAVLGRSRVAVVRRTHKLRKEGLID